MTDKHNTEETASRAVRILSKLFTGITPMRIASILKQHDDNVLDAIEEVNQRDIALAYSPPVQYAYLFYYM